MKKTKKTKKAKLSKAKKLSFTIDINAVKEGIKNWQLCKVSDLADLFYAFDDTKDPLFGQMSQRVLCYRLRSDDVNKLFSSEFYKPGSSSIRIYMACTGKPPETIKTQPGFTPYIQLYDGNPDGFKNTYAPAWDPVPPFQVPTFSSPTDPSGLPRFFLEVSRDAADLFVTGWCKQKYDQLGSLFESAILDSYVGRVRHYTFYSSDVDAIHDALFSVDPEKTYSDLYLLLGAEMTSDQFPFGFRPVLKTGSPLGSPDLSEDDPIPLPTYYEYSYPCPPYCTD